MVLDWCKMAGDLRTWNDDCVDELCAIMFGEFLLGNFQKEDRGAANLQKKGCLDYDNLKQLFAPCTATRHLQISSNTPALTSDEERALEEELANDVAATHLDDDCYTPNLESTPQFAEETRVDGQTQAADKRPWKM
nr:hypothetical protein CFP56_68514 [Quercus suber]